MHRRKGFREGIRVKPEESEIESTWKVMNAFLMHKSG